MSSKYDILKDPPKALTFDVFGTVVNWRSTVTQTLITSALNKTSSSSRSSTLPPSTRHQLSTLTSASWAQFAQEWRNSYKTYVHNFNPLTDEWKDVDTHHHESLISLLQNWKLEDLYTPDEIRELSLVWHFLEPWKDSSSGLHLLNKKFVTSTLSNGNISLLQDLNKHGNLGFQHLQSSADFGAYKPHPTVYKGAVEKLGLEMGDVAMVAAHLGDLKAARECGMRTIYVEREEEEEEWVAAREWVDLWVGKEEEGFLEVGRRFGIE